ncbi:Uncharacterized conserved protein YecE, DUF72 family [Arboricoccus pini]|uniref:Uncharacterized conserved protein YecE, DUF72 family n=1 Tax=Arboricoccus pini TaxID=1963835 RepID=A0A212RIR0_9PROT|nr:DUF72 domain-containing protein [Arboricoccus pini]SNB72249.1 Uncharacterized conserved protein YecE, DUF72 family [Arboricoccus pini]
MRKPSAGSVRVGIGGWIFEPWRGVFYPDGLPQKRELEFASRKLSTIEINGTYYGSQKAEAFARWHDETPSNFVFSLKGPRFATNRRVLAEAAPSIERFIGSGILELKDKLGPINWQFMPTKTFDPDDFAAFLRLLPATHEGRSLRHAVEVRHESFKERSFVELARQHKVAIVLAGDSHFPLIADQTADFVYARIMGTSAEELLGYARNSIEQWAGRANVWRQGGYPDDLALLSAKRPVAGRDVFLNVISGFKERNPAAAMAIIDRLRQA